MNYTEKVLEERRKKKNSIGKKTALLIGRHIGTEIPGVEIVETQAITWPSTSHECLDILAGLHRHCEEEDIHWLIFQNIPGQLASALCQAVKDENRFFIPSFVIVSKLGERWARVEVSEMFTTGEDAEDAWAMVQKANPNVQGGVKWMDNEYRVFFTLAAGFTNILTREVFHYPHVIRKEEDHN